MGRLQYNTILGGSHTNDNWMNDSDIISKMYNDDTQKSVDSNSLFTVHHIQSNGKLDKDRNTPDTPGFWGKTVNLTKRVAGGTADWITDGLTDFDKKGSSFGQWSPIGGGENKKWETKAEKEKNEDAKANWEANHSKYKKTTNETD